MVTRDEGSDRFDPEFVAHVREQVSEAVAREVHAEGVE